LRVERADSDVEKEWCVGPWNSDLAVSVEYANAGVDEPHVHSRITEIYLVARGTSEIRVERETVALRAGDVIVVEPGEAYTFLSNSLDYFHFVAHVPGLSGEEARAEKSSVPRSRLGL